MKFTLYPIRWVSDAIDREVFDHAELPFDIVEDVRIELVTDRFRKGTFDIFRERIGTDIVDKLESVRYALVHRYVDKTRTEEGEFVDDVELSRRSEYVVRNLAACLRLIRPMRQDALLMHGDIREDGTFDLPAFDAPPLHLLEVPEVQRLFKLRNRDCESLKTHAAEFLRGMRGEFWKFRMAVQFHELGHFQSLDWKARYLLWCSAIESLYTSHNREHQGTLVATSRIKWFLGEHISIYAPGDLSDLLNDPGITVGSIVGDLYEMRNFLAHGDRLPNEFFTEKPRRGFNGDVSKLGVLLEAASFIVRTSLLKVLADGLLEHFADAAAAETFFASQGLTNSLLRMTVP